MDPTAVAGLLVTHDALLVMKPLSAAQCQQLPQGDVDMLLEPSGKQLALFDVQLMTDRAAEVDALLEQGTTDSKRAERSLWKSRRLLIRT